MNEQMNKLMIWNGLNFQMIIKYISDRLVTLKMTIVLFYAFVCSNCGKQKAVMHQHVVRRVSCGHERGWPVSRSNQ